MKAVKTLALALAFGLMGTAAPVFANVIISIDQTGANDPVSATTPRVWNFGITQAGAEYFSLNGITFDTGLFQVKEGAKTTAPLTFTLYSGLGGATAGNSMLAQVSLPSSVFNQQYANGFNNPFAFTGLDLSMGYYSVTLTTAAPDVANQEYFLKIGKLILENSDGSTLGSSYWLQDQGTGSATATFTGTGSLTSIDTAALAPEVNALWPMAFLCVFSVGGMLLRRKDSKAAVAQA